MDSASAEQKWQKNLALWVGHTKVFPRPTVNKRAENIPHPTHEGGLGNPRPVFSNGHLAPITILLETRLHRIFSFRLRGECLGVNQFYSLSHATATIVIWKQGNITTRPHSPLRCSPQCVRTWGIFKKNDGRLFEKLNPATGNVRSTLFYQN
jgi:hypothetical protein